MCRPWERQRLRAGLPERLPFDAAPAWSESDTNTFFCYRASAARARISLPFCVSPSKGAVERQKEWRQRMIVIPSGAAAEV